MDFVTLGMFIIDEIHFHSSRKSEYDIIGGAGSWAVAGARFFRQPPHSNCIGWTIHKGSDFPFEVEKEIRSWETSCNIIETPGRLTTRGWNGYGDNEERAFRYITEKLRIDETQLSEPLLLSKCFHLICTPTRCMSLVSGILAKRQKLCSEGALGVKEPLFVWEPVPDSCGPEELDNFFTALKYVDVVSPNHLELAALFKDRAVEHPETETSRSLEAQCSELLEKGFRNRRAAVVVRCGENGCYVATAERRTNMPAYYQPASSAGKVVDPTGAGNAFLGAFCIGMLERWPAELTEFERGAAYGSVAASFAIEQVGLPVLTRGAPGTELWNGELVSQRLQSYLEKMSGQVFII